MKRKHLKYLILAFVAGVLFALFDTATNNADVAPIDADFNYLLNDLYRNFNFIKVFMYGFIGAILCFFILMMYVLIEKKFF